MPTPYAPSKVLSTAKNPMTPKAAYVIGRLFLTRTTR